jgi:hypothetical protein
MSDSYNVEMDLLREFYVAWVALHKIPRDKLHRNKQEAAAQTLVDAGHSLRIFYQGNEYRDPLKPRIQVINA